MGPERQSGRLRCVVQLDNVVLNLIAPLEHVGLTLEQFEVQLDELDDPVITDNLRVLLGVLPGKGHALRQQAHVQDGIDLIPTNNDSYFSLDRKGENRKIANQSSLLGKTQTRFSGYVLAFDPVRSGPVTDIKKLA